MSSMRSQKKTLGVMSSFDPALPVTGYLERETDPLRSHSGLPHRI